MTNISSTLSDPISQFEQFNWSFNLFSESDPPPTAKTAGSSALQSLTYSENEALALSPIGSQCHSNQSSQSTKSSNDSSLQVGGSAQLRQLPSALLHERPTETATDTQPERKNDSSELNSTVSRPTVLDSVQKTLLRPSPPVYHRHRNSLTSELNPPSNLSNPSSLVPAARSVITRANSLSHSTLSNSHDHQSQPLFRSPTTLWMGDLESWMDEDYVRRCLSMTGWNLPHFVSISPSGVKTDVGPNGVNVKIKMISGSSPSSAYCFLTYPTAEMAEQAWRMISRMPPTLMPGCERTFKLNWATGLPGVQPTWDREFSVFIRDLDRDVTEGELVALFTCSFPSTKSAKIMGDLSTGLSRGYAFIRFGEESDMHRALALGRSKNGTGLFLRGRRCKITEASGSSGTAGDHSHHRTSIVSSGGSKPRADYFPVMTSPVNGQDELADTRLQPISNTRLMANQWSNNNTKSILRPNREGLCQGTAGGLPSSTPITRSSSSYPPLPAGLVSTRATANGLANDTLNANFRLNHDGLSQSMRSVGQLSSSMSALRLSPSYPSHNVDTKMAQMHSVPANPTSIARTFPTIIDRTPSIPTPTLSTHYPPSLSRPVCGLTPQGLLPCSQAQLTSHGTLFPPVVPSQTHTNTLSNRYTAPGGLFPPSVEPNMTRLSQSYQRLHPSFDATNSTVDTTAFPDSINSHLAALTQIASVANDASNDPSNTTVFVGGLPACISEGTLKTFFQNFGEITYVKIPPNKGCGFVQYARREDAQQAMLKMQDFPIHGKSRIRLSWGRSLGDKQVEYVKKLSTALGISFESVWKIVQGQDPSMIKQIASALSAGGGSLAPLTPPVRQSLSAVRGPDQEMFPSAFHNPMPLVPHQQSYIHHLPNVQSIPNLRETLSHSLPASHGHRGSWQGYLPNPKTPTTSLNQINQTGGTDFAVGLRGCRATIHPTAPASFPYQNTPSAQANTLRSFDKTWSYPI